MLTNEEIIGISEKNQLSRADVYKIRSLYGSMCKLSSQEQLKMIQNNDKKEKPNSQANFGISIDFFINNCSFLSTALPEIGRRVLIAAGKYH